MAVTVPSAAPVSGPYPDPLGGATDPRDLTRPCYRARFPTAVKRYFKNYVRFSGRASRSEYWWSVLFCGLCQMVAVAVTAIGVLTANSWAHAHPIHNTMGYKHLGGEPIIYDTYPGLIHAPTAWVMVAGAVLVVVVGLALLLPTLAITWRRLHDANLSGLFWLLNLIPSLGSIAVLVLTLLTPNPAGRRFDRVSGDAVIVGQGAPVEGWTGGGIAS